MTLKRRIIEPHPIPNKRRKTNKEEIPESNMINDHEEK